jgi:hypothetical protein
MVHTSIHVSSLTINSGLPVLYLVTEYLLSILFWFGLIPLLNIALPVSLV